MGIKKNFWGKLKPFQQVLIVIIGMLVLVLAGSLVWLGFNIQPLNPNDNTVKEVEIRFGASTNEVAVILKNEQVIKNDLAYVIYSKLSFSKISAGVHSLSASMSVPEIVSVLTGVGQSTYQLTILPEMDILDIKELLKRYDFTDIEITTALNAVYDHPLLRDKPANIDLEGYIFPDTYEMEYSNTVEELFIKTFDNLYNKLSTDGSFALMNSKNFDIHQTLTLASIVTKEAPDEENQKIIAGVLWNRLAINMPLGCDPTYQYAYKMGYCGENLPSCDSTWNTRKHAGLPPGPIANMKYSTIQAVLKPTSSNYYYFVAGDGEYAGQIFYSTTEDEHIWNTNTYCRELCN